MYKLIAVDLDGTLLNDQHQIEQENIEAIKTIQNKGIKVVFCTGRPEKSAYAYVEKVKSFTDEDYVITYNGALIQNVRSKNILYKSDINGELLKKLIEIGEKYDTNIQLYAKDLLVDRMSSQVRYYEELSGLDAKVVEDLQKIESTSKVLYNSLNKEDLEKIREEIVMSFEDKVNVFYSRTCFLEVVDKETNKGLAIHRLIEHLGIKENETIVVGDGGNDVHMFDEFRTSIAMQNAKDDVKSKANYISTYDNNHPIMKEILEKFL